LSLFPDVGYKEQSSTEVLEMVHAKLESRGWFPLSAMVILALGLVACQAEPETPPGTEGGPNAERGAATRPGPHVPAPFEPPPTLKASDLAPPDLLKGAKHEVGPEVRGDGFLTHWTIESRFGTWEAVDRETLELRVSEVYSLDKLEDVSTTEIFATAFAKAAEEKARAVARAAKDPVGTAKAIPGGVARFAKGIGRQTRKTVDKVTQDKEGPDDRSTGERAGDAASAAGRGAESVLISSKRREWAEKVKADPYTTNPPLHDKLDDVGWAAYAGGFTLNVAMPGIPGLGTVEMADRLVYDLPPGELEKRNLDELEAAGVSEATRQKLILNGSFTLTLQTELTQAVTDLGPAEGRDAVVALAAEAESEGDARYFRRCVQLLAAGTKEVGGWTSFHTTENEIEAVAGDGRVVLPWSVDYMTWNEDAVPADSPRFEGATKKQIWISGVATELAGSELAHLGFEVVERRPLER
jgi:hypothetical protein